MQGRKFLSYADGGQKRTWRSARCSAVLRALKRKVVLSLRKFKVSNWTLQIMKTPAKGHLSTKRAHEIKHNPGRGLFPRAGLICCRWEEATRDILCAGVMAGMLYMDCP